MTRCSDLALILAALLLAQPSAAEPLISDAFGLYDPATTAPERLDWSGWTEGGPDARIAPEAPDRLTIFAGPKCLVAGKDEGHVVAIVVDRHGNLVSDGTASTVTVSGVPTPTETMGGIADLLVAPRTLAEDLFVGVTTGQRQSPKAMLSIVAEIASIRPALAGQGPELATDSPFDVVSAPLSDRYGNPVPQGTGAQVILQHGDSYSLGLGLAPNDRALIRFIARDIPGSVVATMTLGAQSSDPMPLFVKVPAPAGTPALDLEDLAAIGALRLTLGPFLTTDGYALADGAQVTITAELADGTEVNNAAWVRDGEVSLLLPFADPDAVLRLTILSPLGTMDLTSDWHAVRPTSPAATEESP
jgi:hypothetical protein